MSHHLTGSRIAVLVENGFEEVEMTDPRAALEEEGATVELVSPREDEVRSWDRTGWGDSYQVQTPLAGADPAAYDALVLPGGVMNPDKLRRNEQAWSFVRHFFEEGKPVAAICHAPWTLIDAGVIDGRRMTSYHTLQTDLKNAGADWVDEEVVIDRGLITSRNPRDLPAFNETVIEEFAKILGKTG